MGLTIYLDGKFVPQEQAVVSVFDHGFLYGDGVFEGIRAYNGRVFKLDEHLTRLYESAKAIALEIPISLEEMEQAVLTTVRVNNLRDAYIRLVVSRGVGDLGLDPEKCSRPTIVIIATTINLYPQEMYQNGLEVVTVATRRNFPDSLNPRIKSLNYLNNIMAKLEQKLSGAFEGIMLNQEGYVTEATADNIFIVKNGELITPPTYVGILEGVTRNTVIELAKGSGIPVAERVFTRHDLYVADECFLTGTAAEVIPVTKIDGRQIGSGKPGQLTKQLIAEFKKFVKTNGPEVYPNK